MISNRTRKIRATVNRIGDFLNFIPYAWDSAENVPKRVNTLRHVIWLFISGFNIFFVIFIQLHLGWNFITQSLTSSNAVLYMFFASVDLFGIFFNISFLLNWEEFLNCDRKMNQLNRILARKYNLDLNGTDGVEKFCAGVCIAISIGAVLIPFAISAFLNTQAKPHLLQNIISELSGSDTLVLALVTFTTAQTSFYIIKFFTSTVTFCNFMKNMLERMTESAPTRNFKVEYRSLQLLLGVGLKAIKIILPLLVALGIGTTVAANYCVVRLPSDDGIEMLRVICAIVAIIYCIALKTACDFGWSITDLSVNFPKYYLATKKRPKIIDIMFLTSCQPFWFNIGYLFTLTSETSAVIGNVVLDNTINLVLTF